MTFRSSWGATFHLDKVREVKRRTPTSSSFRGLKSLQKKNENIEKKMEFAMTWGRTSRVLLDPQRELIGGSENAYFPSFELRTLDGESTRY